MLKILISFAIIFIGISEVSFSQSNEVLIQLTGVTQASEVGGIVPFVSIENSQTEARTTSSILGVYSIIVRPGDRIKFTSIGFSPAEFQIPLDVSTPIYSHLQIMKMDTFHLPEALIRPLPSKEQFAYEFAYQDINDDKFEQARKNTEQNQLMFLASIMQRDGQESQQIYQQKVNQIQRLGGQSQAQPILSPAAWVDFFENLKKGTYKKK